MMNLFTSVFIENTMFNANRHLQACLELPVRDPEPFYRPGKKSRTPYFDECIVLTRHSAEVEQLRREGVPLYLAEALVLRKFAHTQPSLEKRVKEAARQ
jgi:hypothetical protein